jgi:hypothetical protein
MAHCIQHGMHRIALFAREITAIYASIGFHMSNVQFNGLSSPEQALLRLGQPDFDSLNARHLIFMELTSKRSITDWCSDWLGWVF